MLQKINGHTNQACRLLKDANPREFFPRTLEFSPPARGTWNIVHTGLQLPEAHQIYICASGCLRGVILTAAERGAMNRFSTIELLEKDLVRSDNERLIIDGVTDILQGLPKLPPAVLIFTACFHHFMGKARVFKIVCQHYPSAAHMQHGHIGMAGHTVVYIWIIRYKYWRNAMIYQSFFQ